MIKNILTIIFFCFIAPIYGQEKIGIKEIYFSSDVAYKVADDQLFTGQAQKIRRNGHLVFEQYFENGILIKSVLYFNRTEQPIPASVIYYYENTMIPKKGISYSLDGVFKDFEYYNENGEETLNESYENDTLIYRCEYLNGKKHGIEYCLTEKGTELRVEYRHGKKVKLKQS